MHIERRYYDEETKKIPFQFGGMTLKEVCAEAIFSGEETEPREYQFEAINRQIKQDEPKHIGMGKFFIGVILFFSPLYVMFLIVKLGQLTLAAVFHKYGLTVTVICYVVFIAYIIYNCVIGTRKTKSYMEERWADINRHGIVAIKHRIERTYFLENQDPSGVSGYICYYFSGIMVSDASCFRSWSGNNAINVIMDAEEKRSQYADADGNITIIIVNMMNREYVFLVK